MDDLCLGIDIPDVASIRLVTNSKPSCNGVTFDSPVDFMWELLVLGA